MDDNWDYGTPTFNFGPSFSPSNSGGPFDSLLLSPVEKLSKISAEDGVWRSFALENVPSGSGLKHFESTGKSSTIDIENLIEHREKKETVVQNLERKRAKPEKKVMDQDSFTDVFYKGLKYIGPTRANRPNYKAKQAWEWDIYPHGISKQNGKLRVQIKQKGVNPTYPSFPNNMQGLLDAALFRDSETMRLFEAGILVRAPKFNFDNPDYTAIIKAKLGGGGRKRRRRSKQPESQKHASAFVEIKETKIEFSKTNLDPMGEDPFDLLSGDTFSMSAFDEIAEFTAGNTFGVEDMTFC